MDHLLFVIYLVLFSWMVSRIPFFRYSGLTPAQLIILFLLKVSAGIFYGWIGVWYGETARMLDTWVYYYDSLDETTLLLNDPIRFLGTITDSSYEGYGGFFSSRGSYWNDLQMYLMVKLTAVFNVFSHRNYYINVIFYSFISFFGVIAFYRLMLHLFPQRKTAVVIGSFFIPSFLYWASGIHKEGLVFLGVMLVLYPLVFKTGPGRFSVWTVPTVLLGIAITVLVRNYLLVLLLTALAAWLLAARMPQKPLLAYLTVYTVAALLFFNLHHLTPRLNLPQLVVEKQEDFGKLEGASAVPLKPLQPTAVSFAAVAPQAILNTVLRPAPPDVKHLLSFAATAENILLLLLVVLFFLFPARTVKDKNLVLFCLFFSFTTLLTIGYTVNFLGATVRYRSIVLPMLMTPVIAQTAWSQIWELMNRMLKK